MLDMKLVIEKCELNIKKKTGKTLSKRHTSGTAPARIKFACRFGGMAGGMTKPNGEPTNLKMALKKWGFGSKEAARTFCKRNKKSKK